MKYIILSSLFILGACATKPKCDSCKIKKETVQKEHTKACKKCSNH